MRRKQSPKRLLPHEKTPSPAHRPLRLEPADRLAVRFRTAIAEGDGLTGAHCIHERWMRGDTWVNIEQALEHLWRHCARSIPEWLPMRYIEWLPQVYEVTARFNADKGRSNIYLLLLDYSDRRRDPYGLYVGMSHHSPAVRFDQHKAGIRAAGSVLKRGIEVLTGPTLHLQHIARGHAVRIEEELAEALRDSGLRVEGGH